MKALPKRFVSDKSGATSIEYALIAGIIALGIIASVSALPTARSPELAAQCSRVPATGPLLE